MAFELTTRFIKVRLRGTEFDGVEARAEYPTVAEYLNIYRTDKTMLDGFAAHLLDWNLESDGEPIPPTADGVGQIPPDLGLSLAAGWLKAATTVVREHLPLDSAPEPSSNGAEVMEAM